MEIPIYTKEDLAARHDEFKRPWHENYTAMYSSLLGGIVTDPVLMTVPVDDHLVHRADGVFDVCHCLDGRAYCLEEHLARLERSAAGIHLDLPPDYPYVRDIIKAVVRAGGDRNVFIRVMLSRGPGGFSANPKECPVSQLYVVTFKFSSPPPEVYEKGVTVISTDVPVKPFPLGTIKSCDYLTNAMIKMAANRAGADFAVTWDEQGFLAEGATENIILVSSDGELLVPEFDRILKGITLTRIMTLAEGLIGEGLLSRVANAKIDRALAENCLEAIICGTSLNALPVRQWDGRPVGDGRPGPVAKRLMELLKEDMTSNLELLTPMFD